MEATKGAKIYNILVNEINKMIQENNLKPGDKIPAEREIAQELSVSRNSVRQAISVLVSKGILVSRQGDGTYVSDTPLTESSFPSELAQSLSNTVILPTDISAARLHIECEVARLCAIYADERICNKLQSLIDKALKCSNDDKVQRNKINNDLHMTIAEGCGNKVYQVVMESLINLMQNSLWYKAESFRKPIAVYSREVRLKQHIAIVEAIKAHEPGKAWAAMYEHVKDIDDEMEYIFNDNDAN